jgi:hypothetical protein
MKTLLRCARHTRRGVDRRWFLPAVGALAAVSVGPMKLDASVASAEPRSPSASRVTELEPPASDEPVAFASASYLKKKQLGGMTAGIMIGLGVARTDTTSAVPVPGSDGSGLASKDAGGTSFGLASGYDASVASGDGLGASGRARYRGFLGGGSAGFHGQYEGLVTIGPHFGVGVFGISPRIGVGGNVQGNDRFFRVGLQLPTFELAAHLRPLESVFFEGGLTAGYNLVGRYKVEDTNRKTGAAWRTGAFGIAAVSVVSVAANYYREHAGTFPGTPIRSLELHGCVSPLSALAVCGNYGRATGDANVAGLAGRQELQTFMISLGIGVVTVN